MLPKRRTVVVGGRMRRGKVAAAKKVFVGGRMGGVGGGAVAL